MDQQDGREYRFLSKESSTSFHDNNPKCLFIFSLAPNFLLHPLYYHVNMTS